RFAVPATGWPPMAAEARRRLAGALNRSVRLRITSAVVLVVAAALLFGAVALVAGLNAALNREARASATLRAAEAARVLEAGGDPVPAVASDEDLVLQVLGADGGVVAASPNLAGRPALSRLAPGESSRTRVPFDDDPYLLVAVPAGDRTVLFGQSLDSARESTRTLTMLLAIGLPVLLAVVAVTAWRGVGRALAPVEAMRTEVDAISATDLHRRISRPAVRDEIGRLASTMNRMLDRLEQAQVRQRRFVADAAHELRSPIAAIRQHAEVALARPTHGGPPTGGKVVAGGEGLAGTVHAECLRMQALVDDLLLLAQADEHTLRLRRDAVDLDDLVLAEAARLREAGTCRVDTTGISAARVQGDATALGRVLRNVVDNAARHARSTVELAVGERDGEAVLHVDDDGPGVPGPDRDRVFERFVRLDDARARTDGGSGLGLAIVAEIVGWHGGRVAIGGSPLGGARVTVRLPAAG
ncbi:MAG TPA: HAMP domain-containing sensor histidine kinase, partial [Pseudonocardiaceae bacterium]|nr:HAMP domain-containing sensor histidine kinase [Pseudonocardiaceae bacterium]